MYVQHKIVLNHLDRMTDSTGLIQHAIYSLPRRESGYTTDDNARAVRLCVRLWNQQPDERMLGRVTTYLSFLEFARGVGHGFHNFLSYDRRWLDLQGCGDSQGQTVRALAEVLGSSLPCGYCDVARELIETMLPTLADMRSLRAQAYIVLACGQLWHSGVENIEPLESIAFSAATRLAECYRRSEQSHWHWYESRMTYANAVLPHAMFVAARHWPNEHFLEIAESSFDFLDQETTVEGVFSPVGNEGWYQRGGKKALYDQQPLEAVAMSEAAQEGFNLLGYASYLAIQARAHDWFYGSNSLKQSLVDIRSGACCDGLQAGGVNRNQGAESTLAYLWTEMLHADAGRLHADAEPAFVISE